MLGTNVMFNMVSSLSSNLTTLRVDYMKGKVPKKTYIKKRNYINQELRSVRSLVGLK